MEKSNLLCKVAEQNVEVTKLNADLDQVTKVAKMMTKGTDAFEEMLQRQNYGKPKPIVVHASKPKAQSNDAEKQGKGKTVEKKGTSEVGDDTSLSTAKIVKSSKGSSKRKRRDYKSKFALSMSDLVFDSNVNTSEKATEVNPKTVSDVVETIVSTGENPSLEKLGSEAEKRDLNSMPVETEMEDTPTEVETETANESPTIAEMMAEKTIPVVTEEVVMQDVETSLNENEDAETVEKEPVKVAAEKDVETTITTSETSDEETEIADEGVSADEEETQSEESNQSIPTDEQEVEADKPAEAEKEKDVVDVDDYVTTKTAVKPTGGITKRLRSCTGKAVATASKTPAPRVKTKGVGPVKGWSKVLSPPAKKKETLKRKKESSSDSDYDVAEDAVNISSANPKKTTVKKAPQEIKVVTDTPKKRESGFTFHHKLFGNHNVTEHVGTSAGGAAVMTKREIIAGLKAQCQDIDKQQAELEERKNDIKFGPKKSAAPDVDLLSSGFAAQLASQNILRGRG
ncbi:unnamed protein product [Trifolium pratense]|uniref:Uncharacterized protein n=1 Tax=Trifolium pratense TaxID=57577 RepID=A0ACB0I934_TRIPR|nr:unnamed protein product [Trifolium pratense]